MNAKLICFLLVFALITSCSLEQQARQEAVQPGTAKIAYAAYDTKYSDEELTWLAQHADLLIMHQSLEDKVQFLHQQNRNLTVLLYKFSGLSNENEISHSATGFSSVYLNHQDWFLKDGAGNVITDGYNNWSRQNAYFMDPGNSEWKEYSVNDYLQSLQRGWDGLFIDAIALNTLELSQRGLLAYATDHDYQRALLTYLNYAHQRLAGQNKLLVINGAALSYQDNASWQWQRFLDATDGALEESFANSFYWRRITWQPKERWMAQIQAMEYAAENNKYFIAFSHNRGLNRQDMLYNYGSFLLGAGDESYFYNMGLEKYRITNFKVDYETFKDIYSLELGKPLGKRYEKGKLWLRDYEKGLVVVNPGEVSATIELQSTMRQFGESKYKNAFTLNPKEATIVFW